jgi:hypothetical protein
MDSTTSKAAKAEGGQKNPPLEALFGGKIIVLSQISPSNITPCECPRDKWNILGNFLKD